MKKKHILRDDISSNGNAIWRSICTGISWVKKFHIWQIRNGKSVYVFRDNWIEGYTAQQIQQNFSPYEEYPYYMKVMELFDEHTQSWNLNMLQRYFTQHQIEKILNIRPSIQHEDQILWSLTRSGRFTFNSTYKVILCQKNPNLASKEEEAKFWLNIWHLQIPHKCQLFLWKVTHHIIHVNERYATHNPNQEVQYQRCNNDEETITHLLIQCNYARSV